MIDVSLRGNLIIKGNLLNSIAELVQRSRNGFVLAGAELFGRLVLVEDILWTLEAEVQLGQVLGFLVCDCPLVVFFFPCWLFFLLSRWLLISVVLCGGLINFVVFVVVEFHVDNFFFILSLWLVSKLETNYALDLANIFLNIKDFIHESQF